MPSIGENKWKCEVLEKTIDATDSILVRLLTKTDHHLIALLIWRERSPSCSSPAGSACAPP